MQYVNIADTVLMSQFRYVLTLQEKQDLKVRIITEIERRKMNNIFGL